MGTQTEEQFSPVFDSWIQKLTLQQCNTAKRLSVCFYHDCFLGPVGRPRVSGCSLNGPILPWQADTRLEIATRLASEFGHWFSYILGYVELKRASIDTIWLCSVLKLEEPTTSWLPHHHPPSTPIDVLVVLTRPENKLSKMAGNSASYPFKSWPTDRHWVTIELWRIVCKQLYSFSTYKY